MALCRKVVENKEEKYGKAAMGEAREESFSDGMRSISVGSYCIYICRVMPDYVNVNSKMMAFRLNFVRNLEKNGVFCNNKSLKKADMK